jgi:prepilin-type N-terminal cleavage/methylation domain-containing protein
MKKENFGFTLIELLIVVAIIAILAAIAIPNFLAAQTRAKVSRAKGEMRTLATGLEAYYVDNTDYVRAARPPNPPGPFVSLCSLRLSPLTTPVAYITKIPKPDPFGNITNEAAGYDTYDYVDENSFIALRGSIALAKPQWGGATWGRAWRLSSPGPDRVESYAGNVFAYANYPAAGWPTYYDPTNGTISNGDVIRFGGMGKLNYEDKIVGSIFDN